jgi:acetamidase/formamidase
MSTQLSASSEQARIIGGPMAIQAPRPGDTYRWKVQHGRAEKHVYVQIAPALRADAFDEPLRSGIATKGESVLIKLLERGNVPTRIKITSAGITEVGVDRRPRVCAI